LLISTALISLGVDDCRSDPILDPPVTCLGLTLWPTDQIWV